MNDERFQNHIRQLAENAVPEDIDLWPAIHAQLHTARKMEDIPGSPKAAHRYRVLAISALAVLLLLAAAFATPWGRGLAQSLFRFFPVAPANSFPLPAEEAQPYNAEQTPTPIFGAQLSPVNTAVEPASFELEETATPAPANIKPAISGCDDTQVLLTYRCQVLNAEAAVGFNLKEPPGDLHGLVFSRAEANPTLHIATLIYTAVGGGSELAIIQAQGDGSASSWAEVPPSAAVEKVKVGGYDGEYVRGMFVVMGGDNSARWLDNAPVQRLRWREGDVLFEIRLDGHVVQVEYLDRDTLIALAESLK